MEKEVQITSIKYGENESELTELDLSKIKPFDLKETPQTFDGVRMTKYLLIQIGEAFERGMKEDELIEFLKSK